MRWPEGPPHLALNPPYFCVVFGFPFFVFNRKKPCSPLENGIFCLFLSVSLCFSLAFFGLPLFQFLFLISFFLPSCLYFCFLLVDGFLSLSLLFCLLCFCFMKGTTSKYKLQSFFLQSFLFFVSCLVYSLKSLFLIFVFSWF